MTEHERNVLRERDDVRRLIEWNDAAVNLEEQHRPQRDAERATAVWERRRGILRAGLALRLAMAEQHV